jgi:CAP-Gly domain-containing linker protein 3/4
MLNAGAHVDDRDGLTDMTMLHYVCKSGARGIGDKDTTCRALQQLLELGADPYIRCRWTNMAAIHYAVYFDAASVLVLLLQATKGIGM